MPKMANVTVKDSVGADFVLTALTAAPGDKLPARWRYDADGAVPTALRPSFSVKSEDNGPKNARRVVISGDFPATYSDTTTGLIGSIARIPFSATFTLPTNISASTIGFATVVQTNFIAAALIKEVLLAGYAPTA